MKISQHFATFSDCRVLTPTNNYDGFGSTRNKSLVQHLLLVPSIQLDLQSMLLEKLPEYFDLNAEHSGTLVDDIARLIVNQFRWLDFIVDSNAFANKLMQVLSICPPNLKKEIIARDCWRSKPYDCVFHSLFCREKSWETNFQEF